LFTPFGVIYLKRPCAMRKALVVPSVGHQERSDSEAGNRVADWGDQCVASHRRGLRADRSAPRSGKGRSVHTESNPAENEPSLRLAVPQGTEHISVPGNLAPTEHRHQLCI